MRLCLFHQEKILCIVKKLFKLLKIKITKVFSFLQDKLNESSVDVTTLKEYTPYYNVGKRDICINEKDGIYLTINKELLKSKTYFPDLHVAKNKRYY